jgi:hypothetical protein
MMILSSITLTAFSKATYLFRLSGFWVELQLPSVALFAANMHFNTMPKAMATCFPKGGTGLNTDLQGISREDSG